ncbi:maleylpyruvate isomerase family mycothiol-dependent enzyme [Rhabdothermincola salaria]|uniref:maleylpyruvate isomerase family mycothiol-dependent enzyme n=1 Tax=Rhabdothermincola salaria TaxID=2903142 RepID=UPI001E452023|nr:maleylpyruvate isomerase family mycothiol-dependent enzyme [Rhabdothermincola salaria]MCD9623921.1 maleylpyruvate isomerase family mycothiol-dependent enzyme [Rhabdothermincola salaria]
MTTTRVETIRPIAREEVESLAATEYRRVADQLRRLGPDDWSQPTACPLWDVRAMAAHSAGMMATFTGYGAMFRTMRAASKEAKRSGGPRVDGLTATQVAERADATTDDLIAEIDRLGPVAARWRATRPALMRRMPMKEEVGGVPETWRMGYLLETILTRDPWMHRVDVADATGAEVELTAEHDGRIVADVVAEWARRHGQAFVLELTGPGPLQVVYQQGTDGEHVAIDALEFCRILSGRATGAGLLTQEVPF